MGGGGGGGTLAYAINNGSLAGLKVDKVNASFVTVMTNFV